MSAAPPIAVTAQEWAIIAAILHRHVPGLEVWAFGSRARGNPKPFSDLDLAIMTTTPLPLAVQADLAEDFSESDLPYKVDLVDWAEISPEFRRHIEAEHVVVIAGRTG